MRKRRVSSYFAYIILLTVTLTTFTGSLHAATGKPRIIATTDGEIDDRCSMVRFLLYANEWDIEGIIYCSSKFHWKGHSWAGEQWIERDIDLYAQFYDRLKKHDPNFPSPQQLKAVTYIGNIDTVGEMGKDTPGSDRIVDVLLDDEPGPVYLQAWGGTNTIARALWKIQYEHPEHMARVSKKAIIFIILDQDKTFREYIQPNWPDIMTLGSFRQFATVAYSWRNIIPTELHAYYDGPWMKENILQGHGPLCARYESHNDGRFRSEGDSPAFMHQILVGLGSLADPTYGGWGGRFVREKGTRNVWRGAQDDGSWSKPIWRWTEAFQNDWAARADWCVKPLAQTNHNPKAVLNGVTGKGIVRIQADPGATVRLSAAGSSDPDGDQLSYEWWYYRGPSSFSDELRIDKAQDERASLRIPYDAQENQFHIILTVRDNGSPNLFAYRRVIVESPKVMDETPPSAPLDVKATAQGETQAKLSWRKAVDAESGVRRYAIYRNGQRIAESVSTHFVDTGLSENTEYTYQIAALNGCLIQGAKLSGVPVVTDPDQTPPNVETVAGTGGKIRVLFSEPVERASAENIHNYSIDGGARIRAAALAQDQQSIILTPTALTEGQAYILAVEKIQDQAKVANTLTPSKAQFTYRVIAPLVSVGVTEDESPVTFHGKIKREKDGTLFLAEEGPWRWITVGENERPLKVLEGLRSFTILGWVKAKSLKSGAGGNRILFNLNGNRSGMDLVHHSDGRLRLAVNEWPDRVKNDSSPRRLRVGQWTFFAVTYDGSKKQNNVHWYFGDPGRPAQLDRATSYARGPTGKGSRELTVGNYNTTLHGHGTNRQFRGWMRGITIFGSAADGSGALDLDRIHSYQEMLK